ncbi:MAG: sensor domain-containing diguanylate cyclase [Bacillota bacterium]
MGREGAFSRECLKILDNINDALFLHEFENGKPGNFVAVNDSAVRRLGYSREDFLHMTPGDLDVGYFNMSGKKKQALEFLAKYGEVTFEAEHISRQGKRIPVEINSRVLTLDGKNLVLSIARDISDRKEIERNLQSFKNLYQSSLDSLSAHIAVLDGEGKIRYTNRAWDRFAVKNGLVGDVDWNGVDYLQICRNAQGRFMEEAPVAARGIKEVMEGEKDFFALEYPCHSPDEKRWFRMRVTPFEGEEFSVVIAHENITERKIKEEEMEYLSYHDQQTGLYNRRFFENELQRLEGSRRVPVCIIVVDLDGLKIVNDDYGHSAGDRYIKLAAEALSSVIREEDVVARIGGDEFAVLLPESGVEVGKDFCRRLQSEVGEINQRENLPREFSISAGFDVLRKGERSLEEVFRSADRSMYENKGRYKFRG